MKDEILTFEGLNGARGGGIKKLFLMVLISSILS